MDKVQIEVFAKVLRLGILAHVAFAVHIVPELRRDEQPARHAACHSFPESASTTAYSVRRRESISQIRDTASFTAAAISSPAHGRTRTSLGRYAVS